MDNLLNHYSRASAIPSLLCDFYKTSLRIMYPEGSQILYSTFTPRSNKQAPYLTRVVSFGFQAFITKYLIHYFNDNFFSRDKDEIVSEYSAFIKKTLQLDDPGNTLNNYMS